MAVTSTWYLLVQPVVDKRETKSAEIIESCILWNRIKC
jgi:hypothetical protein